MMKTHLLIILKISFVFIQKPLCRMKHCAECLTHQWPYHNLTDRGFFIFFRHIFDPKRQWPYHGLTDRSRCKICFKKPV